MIYILYCVFQKYKNSIDQFIKYVYVNVNASTKDLLLLINERKIYGEKISTLNIDYIIFMYVINFRFLSNKTKL